MNGTSGGNELSRRDFIRLTAGTAATAGLAGCGNLNPPGRSQATPIGKRPNVLFIFDDQLRAMASSVYGGADISTPNMERLANQGATFTNATSTCPLCTPFRGLLQTGRYATHTGLVANWVEVNPNQHAVARTFKDAGYDTGFIGKWHLAAGARKLSGKHTKTKEDRAYASKAAKAYLQKNPETEFVPPGPSRLGYDHWQAYNFHCAFNNYFFYENEPRRITPHGYETAIQVDQAIEFISKRKDSNRPFFLMVAPHPPHPPYSAETCPPGYLEKIPENLKWRPNVPAEHLFRKDPTRPRCYYAMIKHMDDQLGRLLDYLDASGRTQDTIVVFTSDHGDLLGSQGRKHKMVPYAEAVNIPMIVRWPGHVPAGVRTDVLHSPIDHFPTLCHLAGLATPAGLDGADMSDVLLQGKTKGGRDAILMANYVSHWDYFDSGTDWPEWRGLRTQQYTYTKWLDGREMLFDNAQDPYQMRNLAEGQQHLPQVRKFRSQLKDLLASAHDEFLPGTAYADWYDNERNLVKTALGPV